LPIVVSFAFGSGRMKDQTMTGATPETAARALADEGVDAIGANCGAGPEFFPMLCRRFKESCDLPVWIKPSAGMPVLSGGQAVYTLEPESFASYLPALVEAGASFVGGCCGTSPDFIRELVKAAATCESS
jgi:methionine synthase I (cobalamin-dependent)